MAIQRVQQPSNAFLAKIPIELQTEIFKYLPSSSKRILGATCKEIYEIWKKYHYGASIRVHLRDFYKMEHNEVFGTKAFRQIVADWANPHKALRGASKAVRHKGMEDMRMAIAIENMAPQKWLALGENADKNIFEGFTSEVRYGNVILEFEAWRVIIPGVGEGSTDTVINIDSWD
ncbi:hypothetical protein BDZ45DRAFT_694858 [Acephala macrosclerotiorum]|nr:hypothetical protein BDZ45DRAFT_694858 [Acephala macrosclerotiorum]